MTENVLIEFTANTEGLTTAEQQVQQLDKSTAEQFTKTNAALKQTETEWKSAATGINQYTNNVKNAGQAAVTAFSVKALKEFEASLDKIEDNFNKKWSPVIDKAVKDTNRLKASVEAFGGGVNKFIPPSYFDNLGKSAQKTLGNDVPAVVNKSKTNFLDLARVLQDLPFGFQGIQNNLTQLIPGVGAAGLAFSALISAITFAQVGLTYWTRGSHDATDESKKLKSSVDDLNKAFESSDYKDAVSNVNMLTENIRLAKEGFLDKDKVLHQYNETMGKTTGEVKTLDQAEAALVKNGDAYVKMTLYKAAANLALQEAAKKSVEAEQLRLKKEEEFLTFWDNSASAIALAGDETINREKLNTEKGRQNKNEQIKIADDAAKQQISIANKFQKDAAEIAKNFKFDLFGGEQNDNADKAKKTIKDIIDELKKEIETINNLNAIGQLTPKDADIEKVKAYEKALKGVFDLGATANTPIVKQIEFRLSAVSQRVLEQQIHDIMSNAPKITEVLSPPADVDVESKKLRDIIVKNTAEAMQRRIDINDAGYAHDLDNQRSYFEVGYIDEQEYLKRVEFLQKEHARTEIDNQIALNEALIENLKAKSDGSKAATDQIAEYEKRLNELRQKLYLFDFTNFKEGERKKTKTAEDEARKRERIERQIKEESFQLARDLSDSLFDVEKENRHNALDSQLTNLDRLRQKELDNKNLTEQQKADIDKKYQAKQAQIKRIAWEKDKQAQIRQAEINGIITISKTFATLGFANPLAFVAAAAAAVETLILVGKIKSTQAPQFKKGGYTGNKGKDDEAGIVHGQEWVLSAEPTKRYRPAIEAMHNLQFEEYLAKLAPASFDMPQMKFPQFEFPTMAMLPEWAQNKSHSISIDYDLLSEKVGQKVAKHVGRLADIPAPSHTQINMDENGFSKHIIDKGNRITLRNQRYKL